MATPETAVPFLVNEVDVDGHNFWDDFRDLNKTFGPLWLKPHEAKLAFTRAYAKSPTKAFATLVRNPAAFGRLAHPVSHRAMKDIVVELATGQSWPPIDWCVEGIQRFEAAETALNQYRHTHPQLVMQARRERAEYDAKVAASFFKMIGVPTTSPAESTQERDLDRARTAKRRRRRDRER